MTVRIHDLRQVKRAAPLVAWMLLAGACPLAACHLLTGHADLTPRDAALGEPCTFDEDCESNYCSDEVCCAERCNQSCMACNLGTEGRCEARPVGPDPDDECDGVCNGRGTCVRGGLLALTTVGDGTTQNVNALAVDTFDNIIVGGTYDGALQLGTLSSPPGTDKTTPFVAQYTTNGLPSGPFYATELGAITQVDAFSVGATSDAEAMIVGSADQGAGTDFWLHVPARWSSPLTFGGRGQQVGVAARGHPSGMVVLGGYGPAGAALPAVSLTGVEAGAFVALLDEMGQQLSVRSFGDDVAVGPGGIAVGPSGSIYVTGRYEGPLQSDGLLLLHAPLNKGKPPGGVLGGGGGEGEDDARFITGTGPGVFVLRLGPDLSVTWATALAGSPAEDAPPAVTPVGVERLAIAYDSAGANRLPVVVALDAAEGDPLWTEQIAVTPKGLGGDADGVVLAGSIGAPIAFAGGELPILEGVPTAVVAAYDENGGQRWGRSIAPGVARTTAVDTQGHILVGGQYSGTFDLGVGNASSTTDIDGFLAEMTGDGEALWQRSLGSSEPQRIRTMLPFKGSVLVAGSFDGAMSLGPSKSLSPTGEDDGYVARFTDELEPQWITEVSGQGAQTVTALASTDAGRIIVAVCANDEVVLGDAGEVSTGQGTTLLELDSLGQYAENALLIASDAPLECDAPLALVHYEDVIYVAGHIPELAFERRAYIKRIRASSFEVLEEMEFQLPGPERVTGLAVDDRAAVVGGFSQPSAGANQGFIKSFQRLTLEPITEHRFSADTVLLHELEGDRVVAVLASGSPVRIGGKELEPQGSATNGFIAIFNTPFLELVQLVGLGPMRPRALEIDDDGNLAIAGELTETVSWDGATLIPDGVDSFVLKLAPTGDRLAWEHVTGTGEESLTAIARGLDGRVHAGGTFDGSLVVEDVPPRFGSGLDGVLLSVGR